MEIATREISIINSNMDTEHILGLMVILTQEIGSMTNNTDMGYISLPMELDIRVSSKMVSLMEKEHSKTIPNNKMISFSILDFGVVHYLMEEARLFTKMVTDMMEISKKGKEMVLDYINLTDTSDMRENGETMRFMELVNYLGIMNYFSKENSKTVSNMDLESINMKMEIFLMVTSSGIKEEDMVLTTFLKEEFYSQNLTLYLLKYPN